MEMKTVFSVGPGVFTDEDFARAMHEIGKPHLEGWEFFVEAMGTKIYRKYKEVGVRICCTRVRTNSALAWEDRE